MNFPEWRHTRVIPCVLALVAVLASPLWFTSPSFAQSEREESVPAFQEKYGTIDHRIPALFHQLQQTYGSATSLTAEAKTTLFRITEWEEGKEFEDAIFHKQIKQGETDTQVVYKRGPHDIRLRVLSDNTKGALGSLLGPTNLHVIAMEKNKKAVNLPGQPLPTGRADRILMTFVTAEAQFGAVTLIPLLTNSLNNLSSEDIQYASWSDEGNGKIRITIVSKFIGIPMAYARYLIDADKTVLLREEFVIWGKKEGELSRIVVDYSQVKLNGAVDDSLFSDSNLVRTVKQRSSRH